MTDAMFLAVVTGAWVCVGIANQRESIAFFEFAHDGLAHVVAIGLKL